MEASPIYGRNSHTSSQNRRGEWVPAIPLPFYGLRKTCACGRKFWTSEGYEGHYAVTHILALRDDPTRKER
jgi:hypothetical protein